MIVDSKLRTPANSKLFDVAGELLFATGGDVENSTRRAFEQRAQVMPFESADGQVDCAKLVEHLVDRQVNDILVEAGPNLVGTFLFAGLVDELIVYIAPAILGDTAMGFAHMPKIQSLADRLSGEFNDVSAVGQDIRITLSMMKDSPVK